MVLVYVSVHCQLRKISDPQDELGPHTYQATKVLYQPGTSLWQQPIQSCNPDPVQIIFSHQGVHASVCACVTHPCVWLNWKTTSHSSACSVK